MKGMIRTKAELVRLLETSKQRKYYYTNVVGDDVVPIVFALRYGVLGIIDEDGFGPCNPFGNLFCHPGDKMRLFRNYFYAWAYVQKLRAQKK